MHGGARWAKQAPLKTGYSRTRGHQQTHALWHTCTWLDGAAIMIVKLYATMNKKYPRIQHHCMHWLTCLNTCTVQTLTCTQRVWICMCAWVHGQVQGKGWKFLSQQVSQTSSHTSSRSSRCLTNCSISGAHKTMQNWFLRHNCMF